MWRRRHRTAVTFIVLLDLLAFGTPGAATRHRDTTHLAGQTASAASSAVASVSRMLPSDSVSACCEEREVDDQVAIPVRQPPRAITGSFTLLTDSSAQGILPIFARSADPRGPPSA